MHNIQSPRTDDAGVEAILQARGKTAPRITPEALQANIAHIEVVTHHSVGGQVLRWAVLTTRSGFAVTGRPSAAVDARNDDAEVGASIAIDNAKNELWALMGYELKTRLHEAALRDNTEARCEG